MAPGLSVDHGKFATDQYLAIRLYCQRLDGGVGIGIKGFVHGSIRMKAGDAISGLPTDHTEGSSNHHLPVRLQDNGVNIGIGIGIEIRVHRTVWIQPYDPVSTLNANGGKITTRYDLSIVLQSQRDDNPVCVRIKGVKNHGCPGRR